MQRVVDMMVVHASVGAAEIPRTPVDLREVALSASHGDRFARAERRIRVHGETGNDAAVLGDDRFLLCVVEELIDNALKFSGDRAPVEVIVQTAGTQVEVLVADRGPGMEEAIAAMVTEPFRQLDSSSTRAHGGLGLGLSLASRIAQAHGGALRINPRPGGGTIVAISVPAARLVAVG
ncbi:MAG: hypothetical protein NVSMB57_09840 [Actinomycetota bacterium]